MKITILSAAYPYRGGIAHFTGLLYKELAKNNVVDVVTFSRQYPSIFFPGTSQKESEKETIQKIPSSEIIDSINPLNWIAVGNKIKKAKPDLLVINFWMPFFGPSFGTISRIVKGNKKTKVMIICHNVIPHEHKPGDMPLTKYLFNTADYFILLAKKLEDELLSIKKNPVFTTLYHPVYSIFGDEVDKKTAREYLKIDDGKTLLFFGFIREYKGLDTLLKAMQILKKSTDIKLIVAGEYYSNEEKYSKLIDELDIRDRLYLYNEFIPTSDVKYFFSAADVVVLPYRDATQSGIVQIANNFNKPVIATNVGGLGEIVHDNVNGFLVEKDNPAVLAESIIRFYNEEKEASFIDVIKKEAENYSWNKFVNELINLAGK